MAKRLGPGVTHRTMVKRILATFDRATAGEILAGAEWYKAAGRIAQDMSDQTGQPLDVCAVVIAKLSPQTRWAENVAAAWQLLETDTRAPGMLGENYRQARAAITAGDPLATFGPGAPKTYAFALAILGDDESVVIDVWAARVALQGGKYRFRDGEGDTVATILKRTGVYGDIARAYRAAARCRGVSPCCMQATVWTVVRGSAS